MKIKKINVFLPWNLPEYYALNGFHDLYDFILEENQYFNFKAIEIKKFYNKKYLNFFAFLNKFNFSFRFYDKSASVSYLLSKVAAKGCELNFLHTSLIFAGESKPFIFHLEDFQSIFLHRDILPVFNKDVNLQKIFEQNNCLAIISHIPETLQSFRNYFNSPVINSKLHYSRIAISNNFIKSAKKLKISKQKSSETVFLFTSSGHQNTNNYVTRGFKVVINLAKKLIESGYKVKFIFKCIKLDRSAFLDLGLNDEQIDFIYNCSAIVWYEEYLSDDEMSVLYKMSDFFLLPSAQLHSMSILKSMYSESIPIVTDTVGTNQYVSHLKNGIVLNGVRKAVFQDNIFLLKPNIENYLFLENSLTEQLFSNLVKIIDKKDVIEKMKSEAKETVIRNFNPKDNEEELLHHILMEYNKKVSRKSRKKNKIFKKLVNRYILSSDFSRYKQIICQKVFEWENIIVFKHHSYYYVNDSKKNRFSVCDLTKFSKPYKDIFEVNKELRRRLFK